MSRSLVVRVVVSLLAGLAALLVVEIAIAAATPLADNATSDLTIALYLILDPRSPYVQLVALAAGALATMVGLVMFVAVDSAVWLAAVGRAVLLGVLVGIASLAGAAGGWAITTSDRQGDIAATRWWLMDTAPPQVSVTVPDKLVHEVAQIDVSVSDEGPYHIAGIDVDGTPITPTLHLALDTTSLPDGQHTVNVTVEDESRQHNRAQAQAFFRTDTQWWLNDVTPPTITLTIPVTLTRAAVTVTLDTADEGDYRITRFTLDNASLPITPEQVVDASRLPDGKHTVVVEAEDESRQRNHSQATGVFWSDTTPPSVAIKLDPPVGTQGHTQIIDLAVNEPVSGITATLGGKPLAIAQSSSDYWAVEGYDVEAQPSSSTLLVRATDLLGNSSQVTATVAVTRFAFPVENETGENIDLPPEKAGLLNYGDSENAYLDTVYGPITPEPLWQGMFIVPIKGTLTTPFAMRRSYNGGPLGSYHGGVDIAANAGAPVPAANRGRVVLAEMLHVRGNTVIIDHGMGVYTAYFHMSEIKVQKGQMVDKGDILGLVGTTGVSTGPHLHWEMRVTGEAVDPWLWTQRLIP